MGLRGECLRPWIVSANQEDDMGQLYLSNVDFLKNGVPASFIAMMVVATIGFLLMEAIGYVLVRPSHPVSIMIIFH